MSTAMRKTREVKPTTTHLVLNHLMKLDDFAGVPQLVTATERSANQVSAALYWLQKAGVVDSVMSQDRLWWFATHGQDLRQTTHEVITAEPIVKPNRRGGRRRVNKDAQQPR